MNKKACENTKDCQHFDKYKKLGCSHCLVCSKPIDPKINEKKAESEQSQEFFKHSSEDI
jgi:hypothetical protein